jgi:hypothetical protein
MAGDIMGVATLLLLCNLMPACKTLNLLSGNVFLISDNFGQKSVLGGCTHGHDVVGNPPGATAHHGPAFSKQFTLAGR